MFTFARCLRSSAAVTPDKYELDIIQVTTVLIIRKNWENNGTEKIGLVTPTPVMYINVLSFSVLIERKPCVFWPSNPRNDLSHNICYDCYSCWCYEGIVWISMLVVACGPKPIFKWKVENLKFVCNWVHAEKSKLSFNIKTVFLGAGISIIMGIPILLRWHLYIEAAPRLISCILVSFYEMLF